MRRRALEALVCGLAPLAAYLALHDRWGETAAVLIAGLPALTWTAIALIRDRRVDAVSALISGGLLLGAGAMLLGGDARLIQLREQWVIGLIGLIFVGSLAADRPLILLLARARVRRNGGQAAIDFATRSLSPRFQRAARLMTLVWGAGLLSEAAICGVLIFRLPIAVYMAVSPVLSAAAIGALTAWTWRVSRQALSAADEPRA